MPKPQRFCIYCGGAGLTKEHLYADWLREYIPRELDEHRTASTITFPHKSETKVRHQTGDTHAKRLRRVCLKCNGGWMSDLQQVAKPHLVPMLEGRRTALSRNAQKIIAAWATMTAMTAEFVDDEMVAVPQIERDYLRETHLPPRSWRIWIGRYARSGMAKRYWHNVMALTDQKIERSALYLPHPSNTQTTTICFGENLVVYLMSSEVELARSIIRRWSFPGNAAPAMSQIWPAKSKPAIWPGAGTLSATGLDYIANDFYRRVERSMYKASSLA